MIGLMRPIFYDTETTGIRSDKDRVVEIAAYDPIGERTFVELVNPEMPIPPEASAVHRISNEMVSESPTFHKVGQQFIDFCGPDAVLIAHNNDSFDKLFIENEAKRCNLILPQWKYIDTLKWSRKYRSDLPRHTLQHLREVYGIPANQAHRALDDVLVLHRVFSFMIDDLPFERVYDLLQKKEALARMPFGKHQGKPLSEIPPDYIRWLAKSGAFDKSENKALKEQCENLGLL